MLSSHSYFISFFPLLILSALNDLTGPSAGPLARTTYSYSLRVIGIGKDATFWFRVIEHAEIQIIIILGIVISL